MTEVMPKRRQRRRQMGWRQEVSDVYVGRPTRWGNPWKEGQPHPRHGWPMSRQEVVDLYEEWCCLELDDRPGRFRARLDIDLRGRNLVCWCPLDQPCHADVLLRLAND